MKIEESKRYNRPYQIMVTINFHLYFSKKEEDEGVEIPSELIRSEVIKAIDAGEYDVSEESME